MLYAWIDGVKRAPLEKGEKTICCDCGGVLTSVIPIQNVKHWRHKSSDCDSWSENEGPWHLSWKENFDIRFREICLIDEISGEKHRADILCNPETPESTVLELQHSNISEEERISRESFYSQKNKMFWLVHIHNEKSFHGFGFEQALISSSKVEYSGRQFQISTWVSRSNQFIEKWKRSNVDVFFDFKGHIFYLANNNLSTKLGGPFRRGEFAVCELSKLEFISAVNGKKGSKI